MRNFNKCQKTRPDPIFTFCHPELVSGSHNALVLDTETSLPWRDSEPSSEWHFQGSAWHFT